MSTFFWLTNQHLDVELFTSACNQKRRVLNLNKHPATYWIYTRSAVLGVHLQLLISLSSSQAFICKHPANFCTHTHIACAHGLPPFLTQNLNLAPLFTNDPGATYFRLLAGSLPTKHLRRHNLSDQMPSALTQPKNLQSAPSKSATNATSQILFFAEVFCALCSQA